MENFDDGFLCFVSAAALLLGLLFTLKPTKKKREQKVLNAGDEIQLNQRILRTKGNGVQKVGRFIATRTVGLTGTDKVYIGFSLCDGKDRYNDVAAKKIALEKALACYTEPLKIPANLSEEYLEFYRRCSVYFKGCELPKTVQVYNYDAKSYCLANVVPAYMYLCLEKTDCVLEYYFEEIEPAQEAKKICPIPAVGGEPSMIDCARCGSTDCSTFPGRAPYTVPTELA